VIGRSRIPIALAALVAAVFAALLAADLRSWQDGIRSGDARFVEQPSSATWTASAVLPFNLARGILGISDQIAFRQAAQTFVAVHALGIGFDNGYSESRARADLEIVLTNLARGGNRTRDSIADNLLGILAFSDSQTHGTTQPAPVERAVADFQSAVQLDPANADAKFNLEWLLRQLVPQGSRSGNSNSQASAAKGHKGTGGGEPGKGY
jgi:hypothetical protein